MSLRIKNWSKHQHFKDRTPPWIKLYREILDDPDWHELDGDSAKMLVSLWLIASEDETRQGLLPDSRKLCFRLRIKESQLNQALTKLSHWLIQDDINTISAGYQVDAPETEKRREEKSIGGADLTPSRFDEFWGCWPKNDRKQDKAKCAAKWKVEKLDGVSEQILLDVQAKKKTRKWQDGYTEAPLVYLNNRRWEDGGLVAVEVGSQWFEGAGFDTEAEARNNGCTPSTAKEFVNGERLESA